MKKIPLILISLSLLIIVGCESNGYVETSDCKETILTNKWSIDTWFRGFICEESANLKICIARENSLFSNNCQRVYVYHNDSTVYNTNSTKSDDTLTGFFGFLIIGFLIYFVSKGNKAEQEKLAKMTPEEKEKYLKTIASEKKHIHNELSIKEVTEKKIKDAGWAIQIFSYFLLTIGLLGSIPAAQVMQKDLGVGVIIVLFSIFVLGGLGALLFGMGNSLKKGDRTITKAKASLSAFNTISVIFIICTGGIGIISVFILWYTFDATSSIKKYEIASKSTPHFIREA